MIARRKPRAAVPTRIASEDAATYGASTTLYTPAESAIIAQAAVLLERALERGECLSDPSRAGQYFSCKLRAMERECFAVLFLDTRHRVIAYEEMFYGSIDGAEVHPREIVKAALRHNASAVMFAHNHPSGVTEASAADRAITNRLNEALRMVEVRVLDHFIVGAGPTLSFAARGWL